MKKFFVCAAVFAAIFLIIGCGDSGSSGDGDGVEKFEGEKCDMVEGQDIFICEGSVVLKCVEEKWTKQEECLEGQTCNAQTGKCDGGENNDDNNNNNNGEEQPATKCGNRVTDEGEVCDGGAVECKTLDASQTGYAYCKQDCSGYDTSTCTAGGNNGGGDNGGGNGGGTTTGSCSEIFQCMSQATDAAGQQACIQSGNQDGQSLIMALIQCVQNNGCQYINQCDPCTNEYNSCMSN